jgi:hypothetical protein
MTEIPSGMLIKHPRAPLMLLAILLLGTLGLLAFGGARLPDTVATHFNGAGEPDGWMGLRTHLIWSSIFGLLFPLFPLGFSALCLRLPRQWINLPHRDYWLAPERQGETSRWMVRHMLWLGCVLASLHLGIQGMLLAANLHAPPRLEGSMVLGMTGGMLAALATWLMVLWRRFGRVPNP